MAGYTRQSTFADGDTITAALFNNEYNQLLNAFSNTGGHKHDGTAAEGPVIGLIGDAGETSPNNKVLIDTTNNHIEFYVEVSSNPVQQIYIADGAIIPVTDSDVDLGTSSLYFKDAYIDTVTTTGNVSVGGNLTVTGTTTFNGGTITMGDAATDNVVFGADVDSHIIPDDDDTYDLGSSSQQWRNLYIDGTAEIDTLAINGTTVTSTAAELNILDGVTSTAAELNILDGVTATAAEINTLDGITSTVAELNILDGVTASATDINLIDGITNGTVIASKAIVTDANKDISGGRNITITGELDAATLDISGNADIDGTLETDALSINGTTVTSTATELNILDGVTSTAAELNLLDGVTATTAELNILDGVTSTAAELNILDGKAFLDEDDMSSNSATGIASQQSIKAYVDSTVAATNEVVEDSTPQLGGDLDLNSNDITGTGNINITGTIQSSGNITGTLATAAQPNITSLGTLTSLTVDDITINDSTISDAGTLTIDAGIDLTLDADSGNVFLKDGGTHFGTLQNNSSDLRIVSIIQDKDIIFRGNDGGSYIEAMRIDMSAGGKVGIGTSATDGMLTIKKTGSNIFGDSAITIQSADTDQSTLALGLTGSVAYIDSTESGNGAVLPLAFATGSTERMRIDSLGNVGIGTTQNISTSSSSTGIWFDSTDFLAVARNQQKVAMFNRIGDDGEIVAIRRDGSTVGSIGAVSGYLYVGGTAGNDAFLSLGADGVRPATSAGAARDAAIDLGGSTNRFKDLYLSGTAYIDTAVGIGTTSPSSYHSLANNLVIASSGDTGMTIASGTSSDGRIFFADGTSGSAESQGQIRYDHNGDYMAIHTADDERMRIDSSGNVGIGVTPASPLHVKVGTNQNLEVDSASSELRLSAVNDARSTNPAIRFQAESYKFYGAGGVGPRATIDSSGRVGIGLTNSSDYYANDLVISSASEKGITIASTGTSNANYIMFADGTSGDQRYRGYIGYAHNVDAMLFASSGTESMRIDSLGNVLINGTSKFNGYPSGFVTQSIASGSGDLCPILELAGNRNAGAGNQNAMIQFYNKTSTATEVSRISSIQGSATNSGELQFHIASGGTLAEAMRINSSGNVGIGTDSPAAGLHIDNPDNSQITAILDTDNTAVKLVFRNNTETGNNIQIGADGSDLVALTNATEAMRIDNEQFVLIGKTSSANVYTTAGIDMRPSGTIFATRDQAASLVLSRTTNEGEIINFRKDGTAVGNISIAGTDDIVLYSTASNHTGLRLGQAYYIPTNNAGSPSDATVDIGLSSFRYKDLYLSGGAYIGGTGSANHLDDYEEGTWTPTITTGSGSITLDTSEDLCSYTKIGRMVYVTGRILIGAVSSPSGALQISNLPFNVTNLGDNSPSSPVLINLYNLGSAIDGVINAEMSTGNYILIRENGHTTGNVANTMAENIAVGTRIGFTAVYVS